MQLQFLCTQSQFGTENIIIIITDRLYCKNQPTTHMCTQN